MLTEDETKALDRGLMASPMLSHQALTIARKHADLSFEQEVASRMDFIAHRARMRQHNWKCRRRSR